MPPGLWAPRAPVTGSDSVCDGSCRGSKIESETQLPAQALPVCQVTHFRKRALCSHLSMVTSGPCHHPPLALGLRALERSWGCHGPADGGARGPLLSSVWCLFGRLGPSAWIRPRHCLMLSPGVLCGICGLNSGREGSPGEQRAWVPSVVVSVGDRLGMRQHSVRWLICSGSGFSGSVMTSPPAVCDIEVAFLLPSRGCPVCMRWPPRRPVAGKDPGWAYDELLPEHDEGGT